MQDMIVFLKITSIKEYINLVLEVELGQELVLSVIHLLFTVMVEGRMVNAILLVLWILMTMLVMFVILIVNIALEVLTLNVQNVALHLQNILEETLQDHLVQTSALAR